MTALPISSTKAAKLEAQDKPVFQNTSTLQNYTYFDGEYTPTTGTVELTSAENDITLATEDATDAYGTSPIIKGRKMFPR